MPRLYCPNCHQLLPDTEASAMRDAACPFCTQSVRPGLPITPITPKAEPTEEPNIVDELETDEEAAFRLAQDRKWAHELMLEEQKEWRPWNIIRLLASP